VNRKLLLLTGLFLFFALTSALAQEAATASAGLPAASESAIACSGFIAPTKLVRDIYVFDGADNDFQVSLRQFSAGDFVYLRSRKGTPLAVGQEYALVRHAKEAFRISKYAGQRWSLGSLGRPYEDVGRVKVLSVTPEGAVAQVTFNCGAVFSGDLAIPYQARAIPEYTPGGRLERFALPNGKQLGAITAAANNASVLGDGSIAYLNLGESDGVRPGQRFRVFRIFREPLEGFLAHPDTPRETVGELVVLSTQEKSSAAVVVNCARDIHLGDGVELE